jgi:antitoxin MazE
MEVHVSKWGNSLGVRIPKLIATELGIREGEDLNMESVGGALILRPRIKPKPSYSLEELLAAMTPESIHSETDWGAPRGNESW